MKKPVEGSILRIPLLKGFGYAYAKYIDLTKFDPDVSLPEIIKVFDVRTTDQSEKTDSLKLTNYLLAPMAVAGLHRTLKKGLWEIVGHKQLLAWEQKVPDFKGGNSSLDEVEQGDWFIYKECKLANKKKCTYEEVKYLQPLAGISTGNVEILLTMYFILKEGKLIKDLFDLENESYKWKYKQVLDTPFLG